MNLFRHWIDNRWLSLTAVVAIGVVLRFVQLADVPRGYFHDEAWSAVKALAIVNGEAPPQVYFAENNGMDALHVYLIALLFRFTGPLAIGSRLVSSVLGSLTILVTYWAAWELLAEDRHRHRLALAASFVVATLFWSLSTSRSGWHVASMTLIVALSLAALLRGRRLKRRRWFVAAGLLAGLAQYTYPSARFLPVLFLLIGAIDFAARRAERRAVLTFYVLLLISAAIVFAPLGMYFIQNPQWFFVRAQQVTDVPVSELGQNTLKTLAGFSIYGDTEGLHNLSGRPALDPILSVFFTIGLIVCIARRQPVHLILIAWLIVFSIPVVTTGQAPLFRRWTGILPAQAMIIAIGAAGVAQVARDRLRSLAPVGITALLIASAGWSAADYFGPYAHSPYMFWAYDSGMTQVADYIRTRPDATIFLTPYDRSYEVVAITLAEARRSPPIQSYNGATCAVFPEATSRETEWVVIAEKDDRTLPLIQRIFPAGQFVWSIDSPAGTYARAYRVPPGQSAQVDLEHRRQANLADKVHLVGFDLQSSAVPGGTLRVTLALEDAAPLDRAYKVFVHLRDADNHVLAQADRLPCDFTLNEADWRPGDIMLETYDLPMPVETPPGEYRLVIGMYPSDSGARLPVLDSDLPHDADGVELGKIEIRK